jgi:hypothetical protein
MGMVTRQHSAPARWDVRKEEAMDNPKIGSLGTARTIINHEDEIERLRLGSDRSGFGMFGWHPSAIYKHKKGDKWYVTSTRGGYPLDAPFSDIASTPYAVSIENTSNLLIHLDSDVLPARVWEAIKALVPLPGRNVWLIRKRPIEKQLECITFRLEPYQRLTFVLFHPAQDGSVKVETFDEPRRGS